MSDPNPNFLPTNRALEQIDQTLNAILAELDALLEDVVECANCGEDDAECPDCEESECEEEAEGDV